MRKAGFAVLLLLAACRPEPGDADYENQGQFNGRAVNSTGAELMVLTKSGAGWLIRAIHWSSRNRRS